MSEKLSGKKLVNHIVDEIKRVSEKNSIDAYDLTKADFMRDANVTEWQLRKSGGLAAVRKGNIEESERTLDLVAKQKTARNTQTMRRLERAAGDHGYLREGVLDGLKKVFEKSPLVINKKAKVYPKLSAKAEKREIVAVLSDTHYGLAVDPAEVPSNEYNWTISARRTAMFAEQIAGYKMSHRAGTPQLRLLLGGDLGAGIVHLDDDGIDLITDQVAGSMSNIVQMVDYLRGYYSKITIECVPCNHLRLPHRHKKQALNQKWDSFATMIHLGVQYAFRDKDDVTFNLPKTPWADFEIFGHRMFLTHGDTTLLVGNVSSGINTAGITAKTNAINAGLPEGEKKYSVFIVGHVHTPLNMRLSNAVELIVNGTGSGTDGFAQNKAGIFTSDAVQVMFEVTEGYPVGDFRKVYLNKADDDPHYDKIITPYSYSLNL